MHAKLNLELLQSSSAVACRSQAVQTWHNSGGSSTKSCLQLQRWSGVACLKATHLSDVRRGPASSAWWGENYSINTVLNAAVCPGRTAGTYLGLICAVKQLKVTPWVQGTAAWPMHQEQGSGLASAPGNPDPKLAADLSAGAVPLHLALSYSTRGMLSFSSSVSDLPSL